jgi:hypothetical protein
MKNMTIELWSMVRASNHPNFRDRATVTMYLNRRKFDIACDLLLSGLLLVSEYMRRQGVDPDPSGILQSLAHFRLQRQQIESGKLPQS